MRCPTKATRAVALLATLALASAAGAERYSAAARGAATSGQPAGAARGTANATSDAPTQGRPCIGDFAGLMDALVTNPQVTSGKVSVSVCSGAKIEFGEELALTAATPVPITSYEIKCDGHSFNAWDTMGANHGSFLECIFEPAAGVSTRLFSIATPSTGTLAVEFVGFTFKNGEATDVSTPIIGTGGAINTCTTGGAGAITLSTKFCKFDSNTALYYGGAVCVSTETTYDADHTVYTHNMQTLQTVANQGYSAGAVHLQDGSPTHFAVFNAETCVFDSNTAAGFGGAVYGGLNSRFTADYTTFKDNSDACGSQGTVYLNGAAITPKTTFMATNQGVGYIFQHDPQCSWFEYDWVGGHSYGNEPTCAVLQTMVYAGDSNIVPPTMGACLVAAGNSANSLYTDNVMYSCSPP